MNKMLFTIIFSAAASSCTQEFVPAPPTCQRVYELSDKYDSDTLFIKTDTLWPWGRYANVFCKSDTLIFSQFNDSLHGCEPQGYQRTRYVIGDKKTLPLIFKK